MTYDTAVFLGPSLPLDEARERLPAWYLPPARQGDVYAALSSGITMLVLIDGVFHSTPSVWQREILYALHCGVRVIGASSMGALRAAELHTLGMEGVGTIFEWYKSGAIDGDDEVALLHAEAEHGFRALSEPMVNIRATLSAALSRGLLDEAALATLLDRFKRQPYTSRHFAELASDPWVASSSPSKRDELLRFVRHDYVNLKRADACAALTLAATPRPSLTQRAYPTSFWDSVATFSATCMGRTKSYRCKELYVEALARPHVWSSVFELVGAEPVATLRRRVARRYLALRGAERIEPSFTGLDEDWAAQHRACYGEPTRAWLHENGLTLRAYEAELAEEARYRALLSHASSWPNPHGLSHEDLLMDAWREGAGVSLAIDEIVDRGPAHFGFTWDLDAALARFFAVHGVFARIVRELEG